MGIEHQLCERCGRLLPDQDKGNVLSDPVAVCPFCNADQVVEQRRAIRSITIGALLLTASFYGALELARWLGWI